MPQNTTDVGEDPLVSAFFHLEAGPLKGVFTEISGIGSETEVVEYKESNAKGQDIIKKMPGRYKWEDITLKRGITSNLDMWEWRKSVVDGKISEARKDGTITMYDQTLKAIAKWDFVRAWPSKVTGPSLQ